MDNKTHTSDERIWAALAHASGLLFFFGLAPLLIWSTQRRKSSYVAFHALQAFGYQAISIVLWLLLSFVIPLLFVLMFIPISIVVVQSHQNAELLSTLMPFVFMVLIFIPFLLGFGIYVLLCILGAAFVFMDKDFRYPVMGSWLIRYLHYAPENMQNPLDSDAEYRWVAGLGHTSAAIMFFGLLVPLVTWLAEKNRSALIRFQSLQAMIYQGLGTAGYLLVQVGYMVFYFLFMGMMLFAGTQSGKLSDAGPFTPVMALFVFSMCCCGGVAMIATPIYYLLGLFAALRVISGHNFKYPILGSIIWNRQNKLVHVQAAGEQDGNN